MASLANLMICMAVIFLFGLLFYRRQNHASSMGGKISKPKLIWLCLAVYIYFPLTTLLAFEQSIPGEFRFIFTSIAILMWLRAVGELYLLYGVKKWSPKIGIGHNLFCLGVMIVEIIYFAGIVFKHSSLNLDLVLGLIGLCLVLDSFYAYQFRKIVHGKTMGPDGLWFADDQEERFKGLNTITNQWNWVVMVILLFFFWRNF